MPGAYRVIPSAEQRTSAWSGGTTTELAIFPPGASYMARDFAWRLSTATVTVGESAFTALPGYHRLLMVLTGEMRLSHAGQHQCTLRRFEQDSFNGGWQTTCVGTGRDFNLMLAVGWRGSLATVSVPDQSTVLLAAPQPGVTEAFYGLTGQAQLKLPDGNELVIGPGDFLLLEPVPGAPRPLEIGAGSEAVALIRASIWRN